MPNAGSLPKTLIMATERMSDEEFRGRFYDATGCPNALYDEALRARYEEERFRGELARERSAWDLLLGERDAERARAEMVEQTRDHLQEENARLREALKPFSAQAQLLDGYKGSAPDLLVQVGITADDCKRAAEALGQPQAQENVKPPEQPGQALCLWCGEALPLRTPETSGQIVKHLERCPEHPMRELEQTSRQLAKAIAEADAAIGEFASHHPREDGFHPFPRCVEEAMGTLRGRISRLEADGARFRGALGGLGVTGGGYCWCATQEQAAAGHAGECRGAAMAMGMTELRNNLWTIAAPVEGGQ